MGIFFVQNMAESPSRKRTRTETDRDALLDTEKDLQKISLNEPERITYKEKKFGKGPDIDAKFQRVYRDGNETLYVRCDHVNCRAKCFAEQDFPNGQKRYSKRVCEIHRKRQS